MSPVDVTHLIYLYTLHRQMFCVSTVNYIFQSNLQCAYYIHFNYYIIGLHIIYNLKYIILCRPFDKIKVLFQIKSDKSGEIRIYMISRKVIIELLSKKNIKA